MGVPRHGSPDCRSRADVRRLRSSHGKVPFQLKPAWCNTNLVSLHSSTALPAEAASASNLSGTAIEYSRDEISSHAETDRINAVTKPRRDMGGDVDAYPSERVFGGVQC
jgi:hypothetical protein